MNATRQRDQVAILAKTSLLEAQALARSIADPWFRAQALAHVARYSADSVKWAEEAAKAASECGDAYKRSSVRAWEIAALAETGKIPEARKALNEAIATSHDAVPLGLRAEALILLAQAAATIDTIQRDLVCDHIVSGCGNDPRWRCKRAVKDASDFRDGIRATRAFFW